MEFSLRNIKYIDQLLAQKWPYKEYTLINSSWLAVSGIRENGDLDILISSKLRAKYFNNEGLEKTIGVPGPFEKRIRIHPHNSSYGNYYGCKGVDDLIYNHSVIIDKVKFVELKYFLMYKKDRLSKLSKIKQNRSKFIEILGVLLNQNRILRKKIKRDIHDLEKFEKLLNINDNIYINNFTKQSLDYPKMRWKINKNISL